MSSVGSNVNQENTFLDLLKIYDFTDQLIESIHSADASGEYPQYYFELLIKTLEFLKHVADDSTKSYTRFVKAIQLGEQVDVKSIKKIIHELQRVVDVCDELKNRLSNPPQSKS